MSERSFSFLLGILLVGGCSAPDTATATDEGSVEQGLSTQCSTDSGLNPAKAALAVAMANELGRWDAVNDLAQGSNWRVVLSATGQARCNAHGGCPNTLGLLGLQDVSVNNYPNGISQTVYNAVTFNTDLYAAWARQYNWELSLKANQPSLVPEDHKLVATSAFSPAPSQSCGTHFYYTATKPDGSALKNPANLAQRLLFFGGSSNPFLQFLSSSTTAKVAIDPDEYGNTTPVATGACTVYPLDKVYDPNQTLKGTCCTTQSTGKKGTIQPLPICPVYGYCKPSS